MPTYEKFNQTVQVAPTGATDLAGNLLDPNNAFAYNLVNDFISGGFQLVKADNATPRDAKMWILQPSLAVDPLWNTNQWVLAIVVKGTAIDRDFSNTQVNVPDRGLYFYIGSPEQIYVDSTTQAITIAPDLFEYPVTPPRLNLPNGADGGAGNVMQRDRDFPRISVPFPMSYRLTIVERGFVFASRIQAVDHDLTTSAYFCVQRGVGCDGTVATTGQRPLYLVTNVSATGAGLGASDLAKDGPRNCWFYSILREFDTTTQMPPWDAWNAGQGIPSSHNGLYYCTNMISDPREILGQTLNYFPTRWYTPVTTDTGEYVLMFPFGLCTDRFAFSDEIDLIAVSKADAYQGGQIVPITVYGDAREYTAYSSNNSNTGVNFDSGIRVFVLTNRTAGI